MTRVVHTPGPWHTSSTHRGAAVDIGAANGANVALVSGPAENGADEFKANARMIAAAPDLLAALRAADQWINLLVEEMDIEPAETTVTVNAITPDGKRELAKISLAQSQSQIAAAIAQAEAA